MNLPAGTAAYLGAQDLRTLSFMAAMSRGAGRNPAPYLRQMIELMEDRIGYQIGHHLQSS